MLRLTPRWVHATGLAGDHPPTDEEGYLEFARSLPSPEIYDALTQAEALGPIHVFNRTENVKRSYGQVRPLPLHTTVAGQGREGSAYACVALRASAQ